MSVAERHLDPESAPDDLAFVIEQVGAGNYADALQALSRVKSGDARNIFLIALEKQVMRLRNGGILPRERTDIIESLPGLVERARADRGPRAPSAEPALSKEAPLSQAGGKKDPRVKMVVDQYFRHADEWVRKRDFEAALKEIERVLLVDPENRAAREYQRRVQQLFRVEVRQEAGAVPSPEAGLLPALEPAASVVAEGRKVGKPVVVVSIGLAVILVSAIGFLFFRSTKSQYKVGYMYVMQAQAATQEEVAAAAAVAEEPAVEGEAVEAVPEVKVPEVKPPEEARPVAEAKVPKAPVKEEKVVDSGLSKAQPLAARSLPVSTAPPVPSAITQSQRTVAEEPAAPSTFIPVEQPPRIIQLEQPKFSDEQISRGIQGEIVVKVKIDKTGKPLEARVVSSTNPSLDAVVIEAVMRSSYSPGVMSSGPVSSWMTIPLKLK